MIDHIELTKNKLARVIKSKKITYAGNKKLKIYGQLNCRSGKRMKKINRIFFTNQQEALGRGYRPCGHCMKAPYQKWKDRKKQVEDSELK